MESIYIFGHQKPDTDSIVSAISLSYLKNQLGLNTKPARLGEINDETKFVLKRFNVSTPILLNDVKLQIKDIDFHKDYWVNEYDSINTVYNFMLEKGITGVPVVDDKKKFIGLVTLKTIAKELINGDYTRLHTSYQNILNTLNGEEILKFDDEINGNILAASIRSTTFLNTITLESDTILMVGDRHSLIEYAVNSGVHLLIIVGNSEIKESHLKMARKKKINIIRTNLDTFTTTKVIGLSNYILNVIPNEVPYTFDENTYYDDFVIKTGKLKHNNYPIVNKKGDCRGLIRITDIDKKHRKKVILVDHNELEQSVDGLDEAEIIEVVDHHKIGNISTKDPITFRNMAVGCTNTIIYLMYKENHIDIPSNIAGLMLSAILSDTLSLTSPTTTDTDREVVEELSKMLKLNYHEYALEMFKAGTSLKGKSIEEIVNSDIKTFTLDDLSFAVSQVFTLDIDSILTKKDEFISYINKLSEIKDQNLILIAITDIIHNGSYLLYTSNKEEIIADAFNLKEVKEGVYIESLVSRKKQIVPAIMNVIR